tara:strand:+ start:24 stop:1142 length:1119 start_codon:yes stop_codon:yes gene_type:complete
MATTQQVNSTVEEQVNSTVEEQVNATVEEQAKTCGVCYEELCVENTVATLCNHLFCKNCFFKWLKESKTCPLCRKNYVDYSKWDYQGINMAAATDEFKMFRDVINRTRNTLTNRYAETERLEKNIQRMQTYIEEHSHQVAKIRNCSIRAGEDLEYKRGYYNACHFPITELDLYNYIYSDDESSHWKHGFENGFHERYKFYISNNYKYIVDPYVFNARRHLERLFHNSEISSITYDNCKNNLVSLIKLLSHLINPKDFQDLFKQGVIKDGRKKTIVGMPYECFKTDINNKILQIRNIYLDFMWVREESCFYKLPCFKDKHGDTYYFDYEVKLGKNMEKKFSNIKRKVDQAIHTLMDDLKQQVEEACDRKKMRV